ncbi:MAG: sodium-dependent transporter [Lachnospiraceae bacterium]|nr:sodium-dependent transporter [Lachnospiraceae bacterium]
MKEHHRGSFSGKIGYIMAVAGSAVGLGNIWRFPYLTAKYGGGIFLLVYIILAITFGYTLVMAETAIGRKTGKSAIAAFGDLSKKHKWMGFINGIIPMLIVPYYCVIGGWVLKYFSVFIKGGADTAAEDGFFTGYVSQVNAPIIWTIVFIAAVLVFVAFGVKGIERASKFLMPILALLSVIIAIYSVTRPGAVEGLKYYLIPNVKNFSVMTVVAALGQMFYSLSIAMGVLFAYGSYMDKKIDMEASVKQIEIFDMGIAFIAGLMIIPAVFSFSGGDPSILGAGPSLMFVTLPKVFASMPFGNVIGGIFFILVFFAALTSAISLMEASISVFMDQFRLKRRLSCVLMAVITIAIGIPCSLGFGIWGHIAPLGLGILDFFDFLTNSVLMPIAALCTCYFVSRIIGVKTIIDEVKISSAFKREKLFTVVIKYIAPICILAILLSSVLSTFGVLKF